MESYVREFPYFQVGTSLSAQDMFGPMAKKYQHILGQPLPPDARRIIQSLKGRPMEKQVAEIMRYLHQRYRYLGDWRASNRGYVPFDLAQIEQNGYGDCKDSSILLAAMLREAGVTARPALVARGLPLAHGDSGRHDQPCHRTGEDCRQNRMA
ncbi:MAG: transglutaminase-like domain-containing protein [Sodalis sp. (in: enterobacteria)]|uniref:transglutaminase-like domain-containing protein n=1 Tax=Sodalis sp. (in: enterobacteria) TaxID=1898979 RepID=UPI003F30B420